MYFSIETAFPCFVPVLPVAMCSRFPQQGGIIRELVWADVSQKHFGFEGGQDHKAWKETVPEPVSACVTVTQLVQFHCLGSKSSSVIVFNLFIHIVAHNVVHTNYFYQCSFWTRALTKHFFFFIVSLNHFYRETWRKVNWMWLCLKNVNIFLNVLWIHSPEKVMLGCITSVCLL